MKVENFKQNPYKSVYLYLLTPDGVMHKSILAVDFLKRKRQEYKQLKEEIEALTEELIEQN